MRTGVVATAASGLLAVAPGFAAAQAVSDAGRSAAVAGNVHKPCPPGPGDGGGTGGGDLAGPTDSRSCGCPGGGGGGGGGGGPVLAGPADSLLCVCPGEPGGGGGGGGTGPGLALVPLVPGLLDLLLCREPDGGGGGGGPGE